MVTDTQFHTFDAQFNYYNKELFNGGLSDCMIQTSGHKKYAGFIKMRNWKNKLAEKEPFIHEISLNPGILGQDDKKYHAELVHGMVHVWQQDYGKPSRRMYHNRQWAQKMEEIGLTPSSTGAPGGKKTGERVSQFFTPGGLFIKLFNNLTERHIKYVPAVLEEEGAAVSQNRSKVTYKCPCGHKVWGKAGLAITCDDCNQIFKQAN